MITKPGLNVDYFPDRQVLLSRGIGMSTISEKRSPLLLIFLTVFIDLIGFGLIIPFLPTFAEDFGAGGFMVGLVVMSYSLMQFFFTPVWGRLSDRVGRRPVLMVSLAASSLGYLLWGFADSLAILFLSRLVAGFGNANLAVAQAYVADVTSPENRAKGMGLVGAAFGLGFVLGPAIGGLCAPWGLNACGFVAAAISFVDLVLTFFLLPEPEVRSEAAHERFDISPSFYFKTIAAKRYRIPLLLFFVSTFAFANMEATLVLLTEHQFGFTAQQNGWMFVYIGMIMVILQGGLIGRLSKRFGEKRLINCGCLLVAAGFLLTPATTAVLVLFMSLALFSIGSGLNSPSNQSILSKLVPADQSGGVLGVGHSLSTLGRILGPIAGGAAFQFIGMASPYVIGAICMLLAFVLSLFLPDRTEQEGPMDDEKNSAKDSINKHLSVG
jgi:MFS transporter, DHA1 family, tetracycline resistance protein